MLLDLQSLRDHHLHLLNVCLIHTNWSKPSAGGGGGGRGGLSKFPNQWTRKDGCGDFPEGNRGNVANLITKELQHLNSAKVQTTAWIRFNVEVKDGHGNVVRVDMVDKTLSSQMAEVFKGSALNEIMEEMFAHTKTQIKTRLWRTVGSCLIESYFRTLAFIS